MNRNRVSPEMDAGLRGKLAMEQKRKRRFAKEVVRRGQRVRKRLRIVLAFSVSLAAAVLLLE